MSQNAPKTFAVVATVEDPLSAERLVEMLTASGFDGRPITIRATTRDERGQPVTAETPLILVPAQ